MTNPNAARLLDTFGVRLFGAEWAAPMARLTGLNERTLRRVRAAAQAGADYPAARGALAALHEALGPILADLEPYARP